MKLKICLVLFACLVLSRLYAQEKKPLSFQVGYQHQLLNDELSSPLVYAAHSLNLGVSYKKPNIDYLELTFNLNLGSSQALGLGRRKGVLEDVPGFYGEKEAYDIVLNPWLSWLQGSGHGRFGKKTPFGTIGLGLGISHTYTGMRLDTWNYSQVDIAPFYANDLGLGNGELDLLIEMPLLAWVVRPNFSSDAYLPEHSSYYWTYILTASRIVSVNQLLNPRLRLTYSFSEKERGLNSIGYSGAYSYYPHPKPLSSLSNQVFVQFNL